MGIIAYFLFLILGVQPALLSIVAFAIPTVIQLTSAQAAKYRGEVGDKQPYYTI